MSTSETEVNDQIEGLTPATEKEVEAEFMSQITGILGSEEEPEDEPKDEPEDEPKDEPEDAEDQPDEGSEELDEEPDEDDIKVSIRINGKKAEVNELLDNTMHEVVIDGETQEVAYADLVNGYQRGADYSAKTAELKQMKEELNPFTQMVAYAKHDPSFVSYIESYFQSGGMPVADPILKTSDQELAELMDPQSANYDRDKAFEVMQARQKWQAQQAERQGTQQKVQQEILGRYNEWATEQVSIAQQTIDSLDGEGAYEKKSEQVLDSLKGMGFNDDEVSGRILLNATDSRCAILAFKASEYDRMMKEGEAPRARLGKKRKKLAPPGSQASSGGTRNASSKRQRDSYRNAVKTQKTDDWINVIKSRVT